MKRTELNRRDFSKLSMAAFGGMLAGTTIGCGSGDDDAEKPAGGGTPTGGGTPDDDDTTPGGDQVAGNPWTDEKHVCRGLNACKNQGKSGENACAGQGNCATTEKAPHTCSGLNACKYQGGCDGTAGQNACDTKGGCGVPLNEESWTKARESFETAMKTLEKKVGAAPAANDG